MSCYFIATSWNKGAVAQSFLCLADELVRRGHRAVILADRMPGPASDASLPMVHVWPSPRPVRVADAAFLARLVRHHRPDGLIASFGATNVMLLVGAALRVPIRICWYHTIMAAISHDIEISPWRSEFQRLRKRLVYRAATHVVANSQAASVDVQRNFGVPPTKIQVVFNSIRDPAAELARIPARDPLKIVCVGRLEPSKGQATLVRALAVMRERRARVVFLGEGSCAPALRQLASELDVAHRCEFLGYQAGSGVMHHLASAAVSVVTSLEEAFGLVNIESMALSTPLAVSATGGIVEVVRDDIDGLQFSPGDPSALADRLDRLLEDKALRDRLGRSGRRRFESSFEQGKASVALADWVVGL